MSLKDQSTNDITVLYSVSGTAVPGIDYSNYPGVISSNMTGSVTIAANSLSQSVTVHPFHDPTLDFDEPAIFTVILTNGYVVDPANYVVTNIVRDNFGGSNIFSIVATNLPNPVGIDYSPAQQGLLLPINYNYNDPPFGLLNTNAVLSTWSSLTAIDVPNEIRIATVKTTTNGLTAGDMIFGNGTAGGIGWVSADGSSYDLNWVTITNEPNLVEGLYIDQTGVWSNDVLAVSGADAGLTGTNLNVWRIHFRTNIQLVASIPTMHLEGVLTVANDTRYGPWAGKLLTADENRHMIFSVDTDGVVSNYFLGINADQFRLVPTNQDLYCVAFNGPNSEVAKIPKAYLTAFVGDILVEQAGEVIDEPELFFVHWNGMNFESHGVPLRTFLGSDYFLEKSTFAPISMTPVQ